MVRRFGTEDTSERRPDARKYRAPAIIRKADCTGGVAVFEAHQLKSSSNEPSSFDPGPAGFNWIEIDLKQSH
jgi:hypothetical protein